MSIIRNTDGTIGNVISANKFMKDDNLQSKYRLLQSYSSQSVKKERINAGGVTSEHKEVAQTTHANILNFITKLQNFYFSPPSDNLWTITIDHISNDDAKVSKLPTLYDAITATNSELWNKKIGTKWGVNLSKAENTSKNSGKNYIAEFTGNSGVFLAQNVQFTPLSANVSVEPWTLATNQKSFLNFGTVAHGRTDSKTLKIAFLISNWDIGDILFDPWIAAVAQKGLIEDENTSIKAKIILSEYSSSMPQLYNKGQPFRTMECRKQYIFYNCVPINRGEISKNYDQHEAGQFKKTMVEFKYDDYEIIYNY